MNSRKALLRCVAVSVIVLGMAGCAGLPSSGKPQAEPVHPQQFNEVRSTSLEPTDGMSTTQIVSGFLAAMTGGDRDPTFAVAKEYLTQSAVKDEWPLKRGTDILKTPPNLSTDESSVSSDAVSETTPPQTATVKISGDDVIGSLDDNGYYQPVSVPDKTYIFGLRKTKVGTRMEWRIDLLPDERIIDFDSFQQAYPTPLPVFLPTRLGLGPVINQVYLTQSPNVSDVYTALVRALLAGPPNQPVGSTENQPFGTVPLAYPVVVEQNGFVDVTVSPSSAAVSPSDAAKEVARAVYQTLASSQQAPQLASAPPISGVKVSFVGAEGKPGSATSYPMQTLGTAGEEVGQANQSLYLMYNGVIYRTPNLAASGTGSGVAASAATTVAQPTDKVFGSFGQQQNISQMAVLQVKPPSSDSKTGSQPVLQIAAALTDGVVVEGGAAQDSPPAHVWYKPAKTVTSLAWDPVDGSLWIVDGGRVVDVKDGQTQTGVAVDMHALYNGPDLQIETVQKVRISPDGQRAVIVATVSGLSGSSGGSSSVALMSWISRIPQPGGGTVLELQPQFPLSAPGSLSDTSDGPSSTASGTAAPPNVDDVAWAGHRIVVVLSQDNTGSKTTQFYADGSQDKDLSDAQTNAPQGASQLAASFDRSGVSVYADGTVSTPDGKVIFRKDITFDGIVTGSDPVFPATPATEPAN